MGRLNKNGLKSVLSRSFPPYIRKKVLSSHPTSHPKFKYYLIMLIPLLTDPVAHCTQSLGPRKSPCVPQCKSNSCLPKLTDASPRAVVFNGYPYNPPAPQIPFAFQPSG